MNELYVMIVTIGSAAGLMGLGALAFHLASMVDGAADGPPFDVERDLHWRATRCAECGARMLNEKNTQTRDELVCGECAQVS